MRRRASPGSGAPAFGVIADDLSGACDVASAFASEGFVATVDLCGDCSDDLGTEVVVHDANLRTAYGGAATRATAEAIRKMVACEVGFCMLKVDSTLRGPIPEMMQAALASAPGLTAVAANALPAQGRLVRAGKLLVHGDESAVNLRSRFGPRAIRVSMADLIEHGPAPGSVAVLEEQDAEVLADLARWWIGLDRKPLMVGSAGVARSIAEELSRKRFRGRSGAAVTLRASRQSEEALDHETRSSSGFGGWLLLVVGSPTRESARQVEALKTVLRSGATLMGTEVVLFSVSDSEIRDDGSVSAAIAERATAELSRRARKPVAVVLVGGDTARRVLDGLGATAIQIVGEVVPGVPHGFLRGGTFTGVTVATKAGAFGDETVLVRTTQRLAQGGKEDGRWT